MRAKNKKECENCMFYSELNKKESGECHRFPPYFSFRSENFERTNITREETIYDNWWPGVYNDGWCGEWRARSAILRPNNVL